MIPVRFVIAKERYSVKRTTYQQDFYVQKHLGKLLRRYRKSLGLTVNKLCIELQLLGASISPGEVYKVESGARSVTVYELAVLSQVLNIDASELFSTLVYRFGSV